MNTVSAYRRSWVRFLFQGAALVCGLLLLGLLGQVARAESLQVGFAEADITPDWKARPVWIAGYGHGRQATGVHDPIYVRAVVLSDGKRKLALACADLVGLQYPEVKRIRKQLKDYYYVLVSSTHNHEAPDVIGIWGRTPAHNGVDPKYLDLVVQKTVEAIRQAEKNLEPARAFYGTAEAPSLLGDSRLPIALDPVLRVLVFRRPKDDSLLGLLVQWNCHPEAMEDENTLLTADFVGPTVDTLKKEYGVPVAYFTGAVGGLLSTPDKMVDAQGRTWRPGQWEYTRLYGVAVARLAQKAVQNARPIRLTPFAVSAKPVAVPMTNPRYHLARTLGVLRRPGRIWTGDPEKLGPEVGPTDPVKKGQQFAVETEVAALKLGELWIAAIPGELYPEMIYGQFQDPVEPNVDFPDAPLEPTVVEIFGNRPFLFIGLANDEIGYLLPKRQWDIKPPYAYGRKKPQYGEVNSVGPDAGPIVMNALKRRAAELKQSAAR